MIAEVWWHHAEGRGQSCRRVFFHSAVWLAIGLVFLILPATSTAGPKLETGKLPPELSWTTIAGDTLSWETLRNDQPLVMVFWATWCKACKEEWPELQKIATHHANQPGSPVWAWTSLGESAEKVAPVAKERDLPGVILIDPKEVNGKALGINFVPTLCVLNDKGLVSYFGPMKQKKLEKLLEQFHDAAREGGVQTQ